MSDTIKDLQDKMEANRAILRKKEKQFLEDPANFNEHGVPPHLPITYEFWEAYELK